jgi:hypothetical protein
MRCKSSLVAVTLAVLSLTSAGHPVGATEPPASSRVARVQAGTVVHYLSHGQWLWWDYGTHERAVAALLQYRSLGIPAFIS